MRVVERRVLPAVLAAVLAVLGVLVAVGPSPASPFDGTHGLAGGADLGRVSAASSMVAYAVRPVTGTRTPTAASRSSRDAAAPILARPLVQVAGGGGHAAPGPALPPLGTTVLMALLMLGLAMGPRLAPLIPTCRRVPLGRAPPVSFGS